MNPWLKMDELYTFQFKGNSLFSFKKHANPQIFICTRFLVKQTSLDLEYFEPPVLYWQCYLFLIIQSIVPLKCVWKRCLKRCAHMIFFFFPALLSFRITTMNLKDKIFTRINHSHGNWTTNLHSWIFFSDVRDIRKMHLRPVCQY